MLEVKKKIRSCETAIVLMGLLTALVLVLIWYKTGSFYHSFLLGYAIGFVSFMILGESFAALEKMPQWLSIMALLLSNLKLLLLGLLIFALKMLGFSVVEMIFGLLFSQLAIILSFMVTLYLGRKSVEEYKSKANNART